MAFPTGWSSSHRIRIDISSLNLSGDVSNYPFLLKDGAFKDEVFKQEIDSLDNILDDALVYYKFEDDADNETVTDEKGNYNGTLKNSSGNLNTTNVSYNDGVFNKAFDLTNSNGEYVDLGDIGSPTGTGNAVTISCWVNFDSFWEHQTIFCDGGSVKGWELCIMDGDLVVGIENNDSHRELTYPLHNLDWTYWYHIAVVMDGANGNIYLYINGDLVKSETGLSAFTDYNGSNGTTIGGCNTQSPASNESGLSTSEYCINGKIDDLAIWKRALTAEEIRTICTGQEGLRFTNDIDGNELLSHEVVNWRPKEERAEVWVRIPTLNHEDKTTIYVWYRNSEEPNSWGHSLEYLYNIRDDPDLELYYKLNDDTGNSTVAEEISGQSPYTSKYYKNTVEQDTDTGSVSGVFDKALSFNGSDEYIERSEGVYLDEMTLSIWIKTGHGGSSQGVLSAYDNHGEWNYRIYTDSDGKVNYEIGSDNSWSTTLTSDRAINDNSWHLITCTYDKSEMRIYIDGYLDKSVAETRTTGSGTSSLYIGTNTYRDTSALTYAVDNTFNGYIDEVAFFSRALKPFEISFIYGASGGVWEDFVGVYHQPFIFYYDFESRASMPLFESIIGDADRTSSLAYGGSYCLELPGQSGGGYSWVDYHLKENTRRVYLSCYVRIKSGTNTDPCILHPDWRLYTCRFLNGHLQHYDGSSYNTYPNDLTYSPGVWYKLEAVWEATPGGGRFQVWLDGSASGWVDCGSSSYPFTEIKADQGIKIMGDNEDGDNAYIDNLFIAYSKDSSPYRNDGCPDHSAFDEDGSGKIEWGNEFDGSNARINLGNRDSLKLIDDMSISMWLKSHDFGSNRRNPIDKAYGGEFALTLEDDPAPDGRLSYYHGQAGTRSSPYMAFSWNTDLTENTWGHLVITRDVSAETVKCYADSVEKTDESNDTWEDPSESSYDITIGHGYTNHFDGQIDEVRLSTRELVHDWIKADYNLQNSPASYSSPSEDVTVNPSVLSTSLSLPEDSVSGNAGVDVSSQDLTVSIPARSITTEVNLSPTQQELTATIPNYSISVGDGATPGAFTLDFSIPSYSISTDFNEEVSALGISLSIPSYGVEISESLDTTTQELNFTIADYSVITDAQVSGNVGGLTLTLPSYSVSGDAEVDVGEQSLSLSAPSYSVSTTSNVTITPATLNVIPDVPSYSITGHAEVTVGLQELTFLVPEYEVSKVQIVYPSTLDLNLSVAEYTVTGDAQISVDTQQVLVTLPAYDTDIIETLSQNVQELILSIPTYSVTADANVYPEVRELTVEAPDFTVTAIQNVTLTPNALDTDLAVPDYVIEITVPVDTLDLAYSLPETTIRTDAVLYPQTLVIGPRRVIFDLNGNAYVHVSDDFYTKV